MDILNNEQKNGLNKFSSFSRTQYWVQVIFETQLCLTMTCKSKFKDPIRNKINHFLFIVLSLVVISKP